jgi:hypothetical protein
MLNCYTTTILYLKSNSVITTYWETKLVILYNGEGLETKETDGVKIFYISWSQILCYITEFHCIGPHL